MNHIHFNHSFSGLYIIVSLFRWSIERCKVIFVLVGMYLLILLYTLQWWATAPKHTEKYLSYTVPNRSEHVNKSQELTRFSACHQHNHKNVIMSAWSNSSERILNILTANNQTSAHQPEVYTNTSVVIRAWTCHKHINHAISFYLIIMSVTRKTWACL